MRSPLARERARSTRALFLAGLLAGVAGCAGDDGPNPLPPEPVLQARVFGCGLVGTEIGGMAAGPGLSVQVLDAGTGTVLAGGATDPEGCYAIDVFTKPLELGARYQVEGRVGAVPLRAMLLDRIGLEDRFRADWSVSSEVCTLAVEASLDGEGRALDSLSRAEVVLIRTACELVARAPSEAETTAEQIEEVVEVTVAPAESPVRGILDIVGVVPDPEELVDPDEDGVPTDEDSCPDQADPTQADLDGDGVGDVCDLCAEIPDPMQLDRDGDEIGDVCDVCPDNPDPDCLAPQVPCEEPDVPDLDVPTTRPVEIEPGDGCTEAE